MTPNASNEGLGLYLQACYLEQRDAGTESRALVGALGGLESEAW